MQNLAPFTWELNSMLDLLSHLVLGLVAPHFFLLMILSSAISTAAVTSVLRARDFSLFHYVRAKPLQFQQMASPPVSIAPFTCEPLPEEVKVDAVNLSHNSLDSRRKWIVTGGMWLGILLLTFLVADLFATDTLVSASFSRLQKATGITLSYESVEGSFLSGRFRIKNLRATRSGHPVADFDLTVADARIRFQILDILGSTQSIDLLELQGVGGEYHFFGARELPVKQRLEIRQFLVNDSRIDYIDHTRQPEPIHVAIGIQSLACQPLRSDLATYDIVFRSNVKGTVDSKTFTVTANSSDQGERTEWKIESFPLRLLHAYAGGPFNWLDQGEFDARVVQVTPMDPAQLVHLDCELELRKLNAKPPANANLATRVPGQLLTGYLNRNHKQVSLAFPVDIDRKDLDLRKTEDMDQLWNQIIAAAEQALLQAAGVQADQLADFVDSKLNQLGSKIPPELKQKTKNLLRGALDKLSDKIRDRRESRKSRKTK